MKRESLVSITDFSKEEILDLLEKARRFEENPNRKFWKVKSWRLCSSSLLPALDSALKPQSTD